MVNASRHFLQVMKDHFQVARFTGNVYCIFAVLSVWNQGSILQSSISAKKFSGKYLSL
jgi:hypothetical protein